jgi:hypothetical protein
MGQKFLSMSKDFLSDEEIIRVTNEEFVSITREGIDGQYDITVDVSSAEQDNLKAQELSFMLQTVGPKVDWQITQKILAEIARLRKMPELAHEIKNFQPTPDPVVVAQQQATIRKLNAEAAEAEARVMTEKAHAMLYVAQAKGVLGKAQQQELDTIEQATGTTHVRDMAKMEAQGEANQDLAVTKGLIDKGEMETAIGYNQLTRRN